MMVEQKEQGLTTMAFLLLQLKLYSSIELPGDKPISNDHHDSRYDKKNQQQQDAPGRGKHIGNTAEFPLAINSEMCLQLYLFLL